MRSVKCCNKFDGQKLFDSEKVEHVSCFFIHSSVKWELLQLCSVPMKALLENLWGIYDLYRGTIKHPERIFHYIHVLLFVPGCDTEGIRERKLSTSFLIECNEIRNKQPIQPSKSVNDLRWTLLYTGEKWGMWKWEIARIMNLLYSQKWPNQWEPSDSETAYSILSIMGSESSVNHAGPTSVCSYWTMFCNQPIPDGQSCVWPINRGYGNEPRAQTLLIKILVSKYTTGEIVIRDCHRLFSILLMLARNVPIITDHYGCTDAIHVHSRAAWPQPGLSEEKSLINHRAEKLRNHTGIAIDDSLEHLK